MCAPIEGIEMKVPSMGLTVQKLTMLTNENFSENVFE